MTTKKRVPIDKLLEYWVDISKRPTLTVEDFEVMETLGHVRFRLAGHDRGGRVGYRLALDHPGRLEQLAVLDIVPTWTMWHRMDARLANRAWHWMFLALPVPFPETLIGKDPRYFFDTRARGRNQEQKSLRLRSARARALPRLFRRSRAHPRHLRGLSRRPHQRSRARRGDARGRTKNYLSGACDLGRCRRHSRRDCRSARDLARVGTRRARLCPRLRALSRRGGAGGDGQGAARVFRLDHFAVSADKCASRFSRGADQRRSQLTCKFVRRGGISLGNFAYEPIASWRAPSKRYLFSTRSSASASSLGFRRGEIPALVGFHGT